MIHNYQDAMAICRWAGYPDLFLTFTCNPKWPEIVSFLELIPGQKPEDWLDIVARAFQIKLDALLQDIKKGNMLAKYLQVIRTEDTFFPWIIIMIFWNMLAHYLF